VRFDGLPAGEQPPVDVSGAELSRTRWLAGDRRSTMVAALHRGGGPVRVRLAGTAAGAVTAVVLLAGDPGGWADRLTDRPWQPLLETRYAGTTDGGAEAGPDTEVRLRRAAQAGGGHG
jgi:hypothetical protein